MSENKFSVVLRHDNILDNQPLYHAGSRIRGRVVMHMVQPETISEIVVRLFGAYSVHIPRRKHYVLTGEQSCLDKTITLFSLAEGETFQNDQEFEFESDLPMDLPSSFQSYFGVIRYWCSAVFKRPGATKPKVVEQPFVLLGLVDLNNEPEELRLENSGHANQTVSGCFTSGEVSVYLELPKRAFVPGETIVVQAEIENKTNNTLPGSEVSLAQICSFRASIGVSPDHSTVWRVVNIKGKTIPAGERRVWQNVLLKIPPLPPSSRNEASPVAIKYQVELMVPIPCGSGNRIVADIVIGTVPLLGTFSSLPGYSAVANAPAEPPPSYEEATQQPGPGAGYPPSETQPLCPIRYAYYNFPSAPQATTESNQC